jgi:hypothetical protein
MTKNDYEIKGFEWISGMDLEPHPDAILPMDQEDTDLLADSVRENKVLLPLLVSFDKNKAGTHLIYDGVNRWKNTFPKTDLLPCILANVPDPRNFALTCLGTGRKRSTGQRVMAYLEMNRISVLKVAEMLDGGHSAALKDRNRAGQMTGPVIPKKLEEFTAEAISSKLGISDKDVRLGINLMQAEEAASGVEKEPFQKQRFSLLAGGGSIRRWKSAVAGRKVTEKVEPNWADLADRSMVSLLNTFKNWDKISLVDRQALAGEWARVIAAAQAVNL